MREYCPFCMEPVEGMVCRNCGKDISLADNGTNLRCGTILQGKYRIGAVLGQGGFGVTYIARDMGLDMVVAIKEYLPAHCAHRISNSTRITAFTSGDQPDTFEKGKKRFREEGRNLAKTRELVHVVDVFSCFKANGTEYLVMEYLEGRQLIDIVKDPRHGPFQMAELELLIKPLMEDVAEMHQKKLLHRDITPANIIMNDGRLVLYDFGSARSMEGNKTMSVYVTEGYAPLEQFTSGVQTTCTDVYAMAGTIYTCLTGKVPVGAISRAFRDDMEFPRELGIDITERQNNALKKAMAIKYRDRTQTMDEFMEDLFGEEVEPPSLPEPSRMELLKKTLAEQKRRILGCIAALCVLALAGVGIAQLVKAPPETYPEDIETVAPAEITPEASPVIQVDKVRLDIGDLEEMKVGDTGTLSASVDPDNADDQTITWSSSDPDVVSVAADGTVEALAPGDATITARASNGKFAKCRITVEGYAEFKGIYNSDISMTVGETYRPYKNNSGLSFEYSFEKVYPWSESQVIPDFSGVTLAESENPWIEYEEVTWSSGKESVVTVDQDGWVTAVGEGTAIITATSASGKQDSCRITVVASTTEPENTTDDDYIIPDSDTKRLTEADLKDLTWRELGLARNEIYARCGYEFSNEELANYFKSKSWYKGTTTDVEAVRAKFNKVERDNADLIRTYEIDTYGSTYAFGNN